MHSMSYYSVSLYIATFAKILSSPFSASIVLAIFNSSTVVCQVVLGHMCDRFPYAWIMVASTLVSGISVFVLWASRTRSASSSPLPPSTADWCVPLLTPLCHCVLD